MIKDTYVVHIMAKDIWNLFTLSVWNRDFKNPKYRPLKTFTRWASLKTSLKLFSYPFTRKRIYLSEYNKK